MPNSRAVRLICIAFAFASLAAASCDGRGDLDGRRRAIPGLEKATTSGAIDPSSSKVLAFDFIDNRASALVYSRGALTASGRGIAFALLSRGGSAAQWKLGSGSRPSARVDGQVAHVYFPYDADPGGISSSGGSVPIALRFRPAARAQLASVFLNETKLGDVAMDEVGTAEYTINAPASLLTKGENDLRLFFRYAVADEGLRTAGALERISIGSNNAPATAPVRAVAVDRGEERIEALSSTGAARISFYTHVPEARPSLRFAVAGTGDAQIGIARGAEGSKKAWRGPVGESWKREDVDLSDYAGELVRIDFVGEGAVDWGRPQLVSDPIDQPSPASSGAAAHVIVWIVSGMRADSIGEGGPMPTLTKLAESGIWTVATSRAPAASTAAGEILTGSRLDASPIPASVQTLAERFREAGYKTTMYSNAPVIAGDNQGFDRVNRAVSLSTATLWSRAQADLKKNASVRTLSVIWSDDAALPWSPDQGRLDAKWRSYLGRVKPTASKWLATQIRAGAPPLVDSDKDYLRALYRAELATVDSAMATMLADIEALGLRNDTAVVISGDRGQDLFEAGGFGDAVGLAPQGRLVPIVALAPGRVSAPSRGRRLVVTADAYATALDLAQIPPPPSSDGRSLLAPPTPGRAVLLRLPGRGRGLATADATITIPRNAAAALYKRTESGTETPIALASDPTTTRALLNWMSLLAAAGEWNARRWGSVTALRPAFATEHGGL